MTVVERGGGEEIVEGDLGDMVAFPLKWKWDTFLVGVWDTCEGIKHPCK